MRQPAPVVRPTALPDAFRLFIVAAPPDLSSVGAELLEHAFAQLRDVGAQRAWFTEYAADAALVEFVRSRAFEEVRRFPWEEVELVVLERQLDEFAT